MMILTDACTGVRWGELAGLQWIHTHLEDNPRIEVDPAFGRRTKCADNWSSGHGEPRAPGLSTCRRSWPTNSSGTVD